MTTYQEVVLPELVVDAGQPNNGWWKCPAEMSSHFLLLNELRLQGSTLVSGVKVKHLAGGLAHFKDFRIKFSQYYNIEYIDMFFSK